MVGHAVGGEPCTRETACGPRELQKLGVVTRQSQSLVAELRCGCVLGGQEARESAECAVPAIAIPCECSVRSRDAGVHVVGDHGIQDLRQHRLASRHARDARIFWQKEQK
jgi:hypothetical protein